MASARARLLAMQTHFEMRLPSMCLYCKSGWIGFAPNGRISCACMRADRQPKTPKTVHGWKVPPEAGAALMTEPGTRCIGFAPNGRISCACMRADRQPKTPKTVHGWKVPPEAGAALMTEPGTRCDEFIPVNMFSKKAALLDALGYLDEGEEENGR